MPSASPAPARTMPRQVSSWTRAAPRRRRRRRGRGEAEPLLGARDVAELEQAHRDAARREELDRPVALEPGRPMGVLAARQRQVRHDLRPRVDVDPEQHLEVEAGPLALGDDLGQAAGHPPDLLEVPRRGGQVHDRRVAARRPWR